VQIIVARFCDKHQADRLPGIKRTAMIYKCFINPKCTKAVPRTKLACRLLEMHILNS
jgi:hypothetical protein